MRKSNWRSAVLLALVLLSITALSFPAVAFVPLGQSEVSVLRYEGTHKLSAGIAISNDGRATCSGKARLSSGYTGCAELELQRKDGNTWNSVCRWTSEGRNIEISKTRYVTSGHTYRTKLSVKIYNTDGKCVENPVEYSNIVSY